jgi:hypothetical protein
MSRIRAARAPPTNTLLEPVNTSNGGARLPQVTEMPMSPARASGIPQPSTAIAPEPTNMPMLGSGTGGAGGISEGGCVCVCIIPMCMPNKVIAGIEGNSAAIGAVSDANAVSISCCGAPITPVTAPMPCATQPAAPCSGGGAF